jgi:hypothetical protein
LTTFVTILAGGAGTASGLAGRQGAQRKQLLVVHDPALDASRRPSRCAPSPQNTYVEPDQIDATAASASRSGA